MLHFRGVTLCTRASSSLHTTVKQLSSIPSLSRNTASCHPLNRIAKVQSFRSFSISGALCTPNCRPNTLSSQASANTQEVSPQKATTTNKTAAKKPATVDKASTKANVHPTTNTCILGRYCSVVLLVSSFFFCLLNISWPRYV